VPVSRLLDLRGHHGQPVVMTAMALPVHGHWAWDARGGGSAVRVSTHPESGLLNLSLWRDDLCVGTARLLPHEAAALVAGLTEGLAELAGRPRSPAPDPAQIAELETRLARLEDRRPPWRRAVDSIGGWAARRAARAPR
jgi:hypothetical protein